LNLQLVICVVLIVWTCLLTWFSVLTCPVTPYELSLCCLITQTNPMLLTELHSYYIVNDSKILFRLD